MNPNARTQILAENKYLGLSIDEGLELMDEHVKAWHITHDTTPIYTYLGLTQVEYAYFIEHPEAFMHALLLPHHSQTRTE